VIPGTAIGAVLLADVTCRLILFRFRAAPVIYGGIQIGIHNGTRWVTERVPCPPGLQLVMFIPNFIGKTSDARRVLEDTISREDCAFNISRVAFLIHALCLGNLDNLKWGVQDRLHQPQRGGKLYKYLYPMIEAAENAVRRVLTCQELVPPSWP
jgi:homoserine kinase